MLDFDALYRRYAADVYRFALYLSGDRTRAEDITSETFVRVWVASERVRTETVKAYLFAIARNLHLRESRNEARHSDLDESLAAPSGNPEAEVERRSELQAVLRGLQRLPELDRAILLMRAQEEMPYEEIAAALNLSVAAARVRAHRARLKLAQTLSGSAPVDKEEVR